MNLWDDIDEEWEDAVEIPGRIECKFCGKSGLHWEKFEGRFKLVHKTGRVHVCPKKSPEPLDLTKPF